MPLTTLMVFHRSVDVFSLLKLACCVFVMTGMGTRVFAQHRLMSAFAPVPRDTTHPVGFFSSSSWLIHAQGAVGEVTPPEHAHDEAELSAYPARDHGWVLTMSEAAVLFTSATRTSVELRCSQRLHANRRNDISFNPRAAVWDEELSVKDVMPSSQVDISASVFHRCKHDIDNAEFESGDSIALGSPQKRTIILGGVAVAGVLQSSVFTRHDAPLQMSVDARMEGMWYARDYRYPAVAFGPDWTNLRGSLQSGFTISCRLTGSVSCGLRASSTAAVFTPPGKSTVDIGYDTMVEASATMHGRAGDVVLSLQWRSVYDHGLRITADAARFVSVGLTLRSH
ncbi:MAG: hypothetical protein ACKO9V_08440 [Candidatus Kapaibacterium sp.]